MTDTPADLAYFLRVPGKAPGEELYLRPLEATDGEYIYPWINDPDTRPYYDRTYSVTLQEENDWVSGLVKRRETDQVFMLVKPDGTRIGTMGLHQINLKNRNAFTGAQFGSEADRNKGIGFRAKMVLLHYAFYTLGLESIGSRVMSFNHRSKAYSEKCGYKEVGRLKGWIHHNRTAYDDVLLQLTFADWFPIWEKFAAEYHIESFEQVLARHGQLPRP